LLSGAVPQSNDNRREPARSGTRNEDIRRDVEIGQALIRDFFDAKAIAGYGSELLRRNRPDALRQPADQLQNFASNFDLPLAGLRACVDRGDFLSAGDVCACAAAHIAARTRTAEQRS
jgi:hypothetical protein